MGLGPTCAAAGPMHVRGLSCLAQCGSCLPLLLHPAAPRDAPKRPAPPLPPRCCRAGVRIPAAKKVFAPANLRAQADNAAYRQLMLHWMDERVRRPGLATCGRAHSMAGPLLRAAGLQGGGPQTVWAWAQPAACTAAAPAMQWRACLHVCAPDQLHSLALSCCLLVPPRLPAVHAAVQRRPGA